MATGFEDKERNVLPNWRSFKVTSLLGELSFNSIPQNSETTGNLTDQIEDWLKNKNIGIAADLVSSAIAIKNFEHKEVKEASNYILSHPELSNSLLNSLAGKVVGLEKEEPKYLVKSETFDALVEEAELPFLYDKIRFTRQKTIVNPYNPISWVELSRFHLILGNEEKAKKSMIVAYNLSKNNRFILRAMVRLFTRLDDDTSNIDFAHTALRKSPMLSQDPWLLATEIGLATKRNRTSKFIKQGQIISNSKNFSPFHLSELNSALAMVELNSGSHKKSKEYFKKSLVQPNDNALAQAEWISKKESLFEHLNPKLFKVERSYEALALDSFQNNNYRESIDYIKQWFVDIPYSKRSIILGHHIAEIYLKDHALSADFCKVGLISHPNDKMLMNDLAYSLCLGNNLKEAEKIIIKAMSSQDDNPITITCLTATQGLVEFRKGNHTEGRRLYEQAMEKAKNQKNKYLLSLAALNYVREEVRINSEYSESLVSKLESFTKGLNNKDLLILSQEILELYKKRKSGIHK